MIVTSIQAQVKNPSRYSVFVDGKYSFSLGADALIESRLVQGQSLEEVDVARFKKLSADDKAYGLALAYVARRMRSEGELNDYFQRKKYSPELADHIMGRLKKFGYVDDEEFARRWVENRRLLKPTSAKKLRLELRQKKVDSEIIQQILEESESDDRRALKQLFEKKSQQSRYKNDPDKLMRYLASQGFSYGDVKSVLSEESDLL